MTIEKIEDDQLYLPPNITQTINQLVDVVNSLTGGERTTEQKIVDHILYEKRLKSTSGEKCEHGGECYSDNGYSKTIPFGYCAKFPKPEPKSNTLREKLGLIAFDGEVEEILSLVKVHLEKEINQSLKETKYDDNDREWAAKLQYNKAIYDIKQIIKNL